MRFAYYPGCSARSTCAELNVATHRVAQRLGLDLFQLESATCTGARELRAIDPAGFYALNVRILALAEREQMPLMTICNTCTLNLLDAQRRSSATRSSLKRLTRAGRGRPQIQRSEQNQSFPLGALREYRRGPPARACRQPPDRPDGGGVLRMSHHPSAAAVRLRQLPQNVALERLAEILGCRPSITAAGQSAAASIPPRMTKRSRSS